MTSFVGTPVSTYSNTYFQGSTNTVTSNEGTKLSYLNLQIIKFPYVISIYKTYLI